MSDKLIEDMVWDLINSMSYYADKEYEPELVEVAGWIYVARQIKELKDVK
jgi:hypothetical protein